MRMLVLALSAAGALAASQVQVLAQEHDHAAHAAAATPPAAAQPKTAVEQHEQCKAVMGAQMQPRQQHDHARNKTGHYTPPKPLSKAEMETMHRRCAELMANSETPSAATK